MAGLDTCCGAVLAQRGAEDLMAAAGGTTGTAPEAGRTLDAVGMGAGDAWSTVGDLARWDRSVASGCGCFIGRDSGGAG